MKILYERISPYLTKTGHEALGESVGLTAMFRRMPWLQLPKTINRRKLERMIPHFVD